jgi:hypothetical protein
MLNGMLNGMPSGKLSRAPAPCQDGSHAQAQSPRDPAPPRDALRGGRRRPLSGAARLDLLDRLADRRRDEGRVG